MGKFVEDWDAQIMQIRQSYLHAMQSRSTDLAVHFLELMHSTLPQKARITDFKKFQFSKLATYSDVKIREQSEYCLYWAPLVEVAIANHRDKSLREMNS